MLFDANDSRNGSSTLDSSTNSSQAFREELLDAHLAKRSTPDNDRLSKCTDDAESFTDRRAYYLVSEINKLPQGENLNSVQAFVRMMFTTEKLDNGADPHDDETGIYALAAKLGSGIHSKTFISCDKNDGKESYSLHIKWQGKDQKFDIA